jgi:CBS-domain-containing membrane protein
MKSMPRDLAEELLEPLFKEVDLDLEQALIKTKGEIARSMDKLSIDVIKVSKDYSIDNNKLLMQKKMNDIHIDLLKQNHGIISSEASIFFDVSKGKINVFIDTYNKMLR